MRTFVKQDTPLHAYCIIIARTVSRSAKRYLPYAFSSSVVVHQAAGMQQYLHELIYKLHLRTMKIWKRYSVGQSPKVAAHAVEWRRVLGLARSYRERQRV